MRRWKFIVLVSLMVVSLLGIIWVQIIWISNALDVRNDLFNRSVYQSLQTTARKIESARQVEFYSRMMVADSLLQSQASEMISGPFAAIDERIASLPEQVRIRTVPKGTAESFSFHLTDDGKDVIVSGEHRSYILSDTMYVVNPQDAGNTFSNIDIESPKRAIVKQIDFENWMRKKSDDLRQMGDEMINEIYKWELETETNKQEIYATLQQELNNAGVNTPFEFAIIENNRVVDGIFNETSQAQFISSNYSTELFTDRLIKRDTRMSLVFPKRNNYILSSMSYLLGGSMLFSLIILVTFTLSIFFIIRQKKISEMKSDFINNMTHEFKTPIATISLAADTIANPKIIDDKERIKHFIGMIKKENIRMNKQVENILQISSLDRSELDFNFETVNAHSIIKRSIETIEIQVEGKNGSIFFYPEAQDPELLGDREHLTNLVHNLLDNANKYSPSEPEITVRTDNIEGNLLLSVEDKGMGMTKSVQSKIFERFYRQSGGNIHNVKGFGLGLSYVRAIVEAHNGIIKVYSEPGKGTRFEVLIPQHINRG